VRATCVILADTSSIARPEPFQQDLLQVVPSSHATGLAEGVAAPAHQRVVGGIILRWQKYDHPPSELPFSYSWRCTAWGSSELPRVRERVAPARPSQGLAPALQDGWRKRSCRPMTARPTARKTDTSSSSDLHGAVCRQLDKDGQREWRALCSQGALLVLQSPPLARQTSASIEAGCRVILM